MCRVVGDEVPTPIPFSTCRFQDGVTSRCDYPSIVVPQGLEPQFHGPKPRVLPLDEGTK